MANKATFKSSQVKKADTINYEGGAAYSLEAKAALAQLAVTGCFNSTYYVSEETQLDQVLTLTRQCDLEFVAKLAIYARESGFMKDMPAALVVWLSTMDAKLTRKVFPRVIDNGKMLRNFVQMIRSGVFGRHNCSSATMKRMIHSWFESRTDEQVFFQSVGSDPSMADIIKLARVPPKTLSRSALYAYLIGKKIGKFEGKEFDVSTSLPAVVASYEAYRRSPEGQLPAAPFEMLLGLQLKSEDWKHLASKATWTQTFKSLNTFARQGVFEDAEMVTKIAERLQNAEYIRKSKVFPYQILTAYKAIVDSHSLYRNVGYLSYKTKKSHSEGIPPKIVEALQAAMEVATENIPSFEGKNIVICPDVSRSMSGGFITGSRKGSTTKVRPIDVAALTTASVLRRNPSARVIPFAGDVVPVSLDGKASVMTNAQVLSAIGGGSTNCAAPLVKLNWESASVDLVIFVSDNESWSGRHGITIGTPMAEQWRILHKRNPKSKLVCIDLTPNQTTQVQDRSDVLNIGGFSDTVFHTLDAFVSGSGKEHWVDLIEKTPL